MMYKLKIVVLILPHSHGTVEKVMLSDFLSLCNFVFYFVILCGSMNYVLPQRNTKAITKVHKGLSNSFNS